MTRNPLNPPYQGDWKGKMTRNPLNPPYQGDYDTQLPKSPLSGGLERRKDDS